MSIFEYDEEKTKKFLREEAIEIGIEEGKLLGILQGRSEGMSEGIAIGKELGKSEFLINILEELGEIPENLQNKIKSQKDENILKEWLKKSIRVSSIEEFNDFI